MFETIERDDVGVAMDRAWATGLEIPMGLGRHDNDQMFSFYVRSPAGFLVEVGSGARSVVEPWTDNRRYDRTSVWGHQPLRVGWDRPGERLAIGGWPAGGPPLQMCHS
jgi:hypothetical protein